jgi:hypothetical protein
MNPVQDPLGEVKRALIEFFSDYLVIGPNSKRELVALKRTCVPTYLLQNFLGEQGIGMKAPMRLIRETALPYLIEHVDRVDRLRNAFDVCMEYKTLGYITLFLEPNMDGSVRFYPACGD